MVVLLVVELQTPDPQRVCMLKELFILQKLHLKKVKCSLKYEK